MNRRVKNEIFRILHKIHIYAGLFGSAFLILMGIAAINFQHHFFEPKHNIAESYQEKIHFVKEMSQDSLALSIKDSLGIFGDIVSWEYHSDSTGYLDFLVKRPGCEYRISLNRNIPMVKIEPVKTGLGGVIYELHESKGEIGRIWYFDLWTIYKELAIISLFLSIAISIYFWFKKSVKTKVHWVLVITSFSMFVFLILAICVIG